MTATARKTAPPVTAWTIRPRLAAWNALRAEVSLATDRALADRLGVAESTVGRVLAGRQSPAAPFIAATLVAFPFASFDRLFTVVSATASAS